MASATQQVRSDVQHGAAAVADKAKDMASSVAHAAGNMATTVGKTAEDATSSVGGGMKSLAGTIRDKAPQSGMMGSAAASVADTLETSGKYLQEQGLSGIGEDITNLIRRNPFPAILVGIGVGYLIARATRS